MSYTGRPHTSRGTPVNPVDDRRFVTILDASKRKFRNILSGPANQQIMVPAKILAGLHSVLDTTVHEDLLKSERVNTLLQETIPSYQAGVQLRLMRKDADYMQRFNENLRFLTNFVMELAAGNTLEITADQSERVACSSAELAELNRDQQRGGPDATVGELHPNRTRAAAIEAVLTESRRVGNNRRVEESRRHQEDTQGEQLPPPQSPQTRRRVTFADPISDWRQIGEDGLLLPSSSSPPLLPDSQQRPAPSERRGRRRTVIPADGGPSYTVQDMWSTTEMVMDEVGEILSGIDFDLENPITQSYKAYYAAYYSRKNVQEMAALADFFLKRTGIQYNEFGVAFNVTQHLASEQGDRRVGQPEERRRREYERTEIGDIYRRSHHPDTIRHYLEKISKPFCKFNNEYFFVFNNGNAQVTRGRQLFTRSERGPPSALDIGPEAASTLSSIYRQSTRGFHGGVGASFSGNSGVFRREDDLNPMNRHISPMFLKVLNECIMQIGHRGLYLNEDIEQHFSDLYLGVWLICYWYVLTHSENEQTGVVRMLEISTLSYRQLCECYLANAVMAYMDLIMFTERDSEVLAQTDICYRPTIDLKMPLKDMLNDPGSNYPFDSSGRARPTFDPTRGQSTEAELVDMASDVGVVRYGIATGNVQTFFHDDGTSELVLDNRMKVPESDVYIERLSGRGYTGNGAPSDIFAHAKLQRSTFIRHICKLVLGAKLPSNPDALGRWARYFQQGVTITVAHLFAKIHTVGRFGSEETNLSDGSNDYDISEDARHVYPALSMSEPNRRMAFIGINALVLQMASIQYFLYPTIPGRLESNQQKSEVKKEFSRRVVTSVLNAVEPLYKYLSSFAAFPGLYHILFVYNSDSAMDFSTFASRTAPTETRRRAILPLLCVHLAKHISYFMSDNKTWYHTRSNIALKNIMLQEIEHNFNFLFRQAKGDVVELHNNFFFSNHFGYALYRIDTLDKFTALVNDGYLYAQ